MQRIPLKHCPACGAETFRVVSEKQFECESCGFIYFQNVAAAAVAVIEAEGKVLVVRRAKEPDLGMLDLPGGFVDPGESLEQALVRELEEELGLALEVKDCGEYFYSSVNEYFYKGILYHSLDLFFLVQLEQQPVIQPADDVGGYEWLAPEEIPFEAIAFSSVRDALHYYVQQQGYGSSQG